MSQKLNRRDFLRSAAFAAGTAALPVSFAAAGAPQQDTPADDGPAISATAIYDLQRAFVDWRFGMFIHFNMGTYHDAEWVDPGKDPKSFNPTRLDCGQWAAAAKSAGMKFAALTAKHHDGFCLWPTKVTGYNVMNSSVPRDIVRLYVDAFRAQGVTPCLYYSIWDRQQGIQAGSVSRADIDFIKTQLTELLTGYGPIPLLIFDGWFWQMGHKQVPYAEIRAHVKSLQPDCLILDHNGQVEPWEVDLIYFEEPLRIWAPTNNTYASVQGQNIVNTGWFWHPATPSAAARSVNDIVTTHIKALEGRYCNFLLNCPPNPQGLLDTNIVNRLREVGGAWSPNSARAPLPAQPEVLLYPVAPVSASATSGTAANAIDGHLTQPGNGSQTLWQSNAGLPQSITLDLGAVYNNLDALFYLPRQKENDGSFNTTGNITGYRVSVSTNGSSFSQVASGSWAPDNKVKRVRFTPTSARYIRLEATSANGANYAISSELGVGGIAARPTTGTTPTPTPVGPTPTPVPNPGIDPNATYKLVARHSGKVLDVSGASTADGAAVQQWSDQGGANQQWRFVDAGGGYYKVVARHSGKVLDVNAASTVDGANVIQWSDTGSPNQQWQVLALGGGYYKLLARHSGKALDVTARSTADGALIEQWADNGGTNQQWLLVQV